mmetsp:Transcript_7599/g.22777  ORF Transcript_7599/g.22777 Transcript_7599/m.22777 type:complete len:136 (-) Transcript_7599:7-414(-)
MFQNGNGAFTRPSAIENAKAMEPSQWWTMYGKHVPMLASIAQQVLLQPTAASAAERNWSVYGQIHSQARSRMSHEVADKLVFSHESMHVQMRMQSAAWSPDVIKWDSDDDSDQEDDWVGDEALSPSVETVQKLLI